AERRGVRDTSVIDLYDRACGWGYLPGCTQVARMYEAGIVVARDENRARELYRSSCSAGDPAACVKLGPVRGTPAEAARIYDQACNERVTDGCASLAALYAAGKGVPLDVAKARVLYDRGCRAGDITACVGLADILRRGPASDQGRALDLYERACNANAGRACTQAGHMYRQLGRTGLSQEWYERGCNLGDEGGCRWMRTPR